MEEENLEKTPNKNDINLLNEEEGNSMSETTQEKELERLTNTDKVDFLNITPKAADPSWALIGTGITSIDNAYNAKVSDEHWVAETNERHALDGYALGVDLNQTAYKGDGVFEFVDDIMYYMKKGKDCETTKLEVYKYRVDETGDTPKYDARLLNVLVVPDSDSREGGNALKVKYKIQVQGDPKFGTVTFANGKPVFAEKGQVDNQETTYSETSEVE